MVSSMYVPRATLPSLVFIWYHLRMCVWSNSTKSFCVNCTRNTTRLRAGCPLRCSKWSLLHLLRRIIPSQNQSQKRPAKKTRKRPKSQKSLVGSNALRLTIIRQCWFWWNKVSMRRYWFSRVCWVRRTTKRTHVLIISIELFLSSVYCVISWFCAERFCMNSVICSQYCKECYVLP